MNIEVKEMLGTLISAVVAQFISIWNRIKLWLSISWWRNQGIMKLRGFFGKLLNVKPRDKKDYYPVFRWLVSKRLAFALVIIAGVLGLYYILVLSPAAIKDSGGKAVNLPVYKYNSIPLKFATGNVRIKARRGYIAYEGAVEKGQVKGQGKLFAQNGSLVYEGKFENNMYNGKGSLFYPSGALKYEGAFADNLYSGEGSFYRATGSVEYTGQFLNGLRSGKGTLYNASGAPVYTGSFQLGHLLYSELLGITAADVAQMYTGQRGVYSAGDEYCVEMRDINAVYSVSSGEDTLEAEWKVNQVLVLSDSIVMGNKTLSKINQLTAWFGQPDYYGEAWVTLPEAVAANLMKEKSPFGAITMKKTDTFNDVFEVTEYDKDYRLYIFAYKLDGLMYTFYCAESGMQNFSMYAITSD